VAPAVAMDVNVNQKRCYSKALEKLMNNGQAAHFALGLNSL
jgi:hypothetical protein